MTEKIINVYNSGSIPIYIGDDDYAKGVFNHKSFICVHDFDTYDECINYILSLSDNDIVNYLKEPIFKISSDSDIFLEMDNKYAAGNRKIIYKIKKLLGENVADELLYDKTIDKNIIQSVIINLKQDEEKYERLSNKLTKFGMPHKRFNAILGMDIYEDFKNNNRFLKNGYNLRPHQIGVWQSHYVIWKQMIEENIDKLYIFEDDCLFVNDFKNMYNKTLNLLKDKEYNIVFLGYSGSNVDINKELYLLNTGVPRCTHSYILSLNGAKKLVEKLKIIDYPIDEIIGRMFHKKELNGYRTSYILVYQPWQKRKDKYPLPSKYTNEYNDLI